MRQVVDTLAMSAPQYAAPDALRKRVLRSIEGEAPSRRPRHRTRWAVALAARPAYAAALGVIVAVAAALAVALHRDGTHVLQAKVDSSAGQAELQLSRGRGTLVVRHFPPPAPGHVYEVWLQRATGHPIPTRTLFSVTVGGAADIGLSGSLGGVRAVLVTEELAGGSVVSSHTPLIVAPVT